MRKLMFAAAKDMISAQGVTIGFEQIAMDEVVSRAGVSRSSTYRIWPTRDDFVSDLLLNFVGPDWLGTAAFDAETLLIVTRVVLDHWERMGNCTGPEIADYRRSVVQEAVRQALEHSITHSVTTIDWQVYAALMATGRGNSTTRHPLAAEQERAETAFVDRMTGFYAAVCAAMGLRLRDPTLSYRHVVLACAASLEGLALRKVLVDANASNAQPTRSDWSLGDIVNKPVSGPAIDGGTTDWTLAALSFLGVFDALIEADPDWKPTTEGRSAVEELQHQASQAMKAKDAHAQTAGDPNQQMLSR